MKSTNHPTSRFSTAEPSADGIALLREEVDNELLEFDSGNSDSQRIHDFLRELSPASLLTSLRKTLDANFLLLVGLDDEHHIAYVIEHTADEGEISQDNLRLLPTILNKEIDPRKYSGDESYFTGEILDNRFPTCCFAARAVPGKGTATAAIFVGFNEAPSPETSKLAESLLTFAANIVEIRLQLQNEAELRESAEEHLRRAQKLSNVGKLASGIAHDFNNLLTVIQGHTALLELSVEEGLDEKSIESLGLIMTASQQAVDLTKQLLLFGRNEATKLETCNLNAVVEDFVRMIRRMVEESIDLNVRIDSSIGSVKADKSKIGQVLMNLIVNARDAMPDGGVIEVATSMIRVDSSDTRPVPAGNYVCLTVKDTGGGMSLSQQRKIFDPFFSTKGKGKGTGLGLTNVAEIIRDHNGHIDVTSKRGRGTTFEVIIPAVQATPKPTSTFQSDHGKDSLKGCKVLLVEDESAVRKLVRKLLEMLGCQVIEAASGKKALELWPLIGNDISVVVTDVVMPEGVSGWDLAKYLHSRHPNLGILLTSGYNEGPEDHGLGDEPTIAFLQKPYESTNLKKTLARLLELKQACD